MGPQLGEIAYISEVLRWPKLMRRFIVTYKNSHPVQKSFP